MRFLKVSSFGLVAMILFSCNRNFKTKEYYYDYQEVESQSNLEDQDLNEDIRPYREELELEMSRVLAYGLVPLVKEQPEGTMGNYMTDLLLEEVQEELGETIDLCIMNYGGMRVPVIDSGAITLGDVYEWMPFDNTLVKSEVDGSELMKFIDHMMARGGWPVSNGVQITKEPGGESFVLINGKRLNPEKKYSLLINSYLSNGGDGCSFMTTWKNQDLSWLIRDKIIEHLEELNQEGGKVYSELNGRIIIFE